ncbi:hypothetical protein ACIRRA_44625 [Nocardia sp. NPDC101769]|uniref:hypothetical protein n=1 Tax=Nocardia sp. NPDC101769 TaxID=3364333 RepID=UPI0038141064
MIPSRDYPNRPCGAAAVLCTAVVWAAIDESRGAVIAVLCFAIAVAMSALAVLAIGIALLPDVPGVSYRSRELVWGPGLPMVVLGAAVAVAGGIWWCLQRWTDRD